MTTFVPFTDNLKIGSAFDDEHRELCALLDRLGEVMALGLGQAEAARAMGEFVWTCSEHFRAEEDVLVRSGYPDAEAHRAEHTLLLTRVKEYQRKMQAGQLALTPPLLRSLTAWLTNHILTTDRRHAEYLAQHTEA